MVPRKHWYYAHDEANERVNLDIETDIQGYDLDGQIIKAARENARCAGVENLIHFQQRDVKDLSHPKNTAFLLPILLMGRGLKRRKTFRRCTVRWEKVFRAWIPGLCILSRLTRIRSVILEDRRTGTEKYIMG